MLTPNRIFGKKYGGLNPRLKTILGGALSVAILVGLLALGSSSSWLNFESAPLKAEVAESEERPAPPLINSITPLTASVGKLVYINGKNFGVTESENTVKFGDTVANINTIGYAAGDTMTIVAVVPNTGSDGSFPVTVTTASGTAISVVEFEVDGLSADVPIIEGIDPAGGAVGDEVYLLGENLPEAASAVMVDFAGGSGSKVRASQVAVVYLEGRRALKFAVPAGAVTGHITLTVKGVTSDSGFDFVVEEIAAETAVAAQPDENDLFTESVEEDFIFENEEGAADFENLTESFEETAGLEDSAADELPTEMIAETESAAASDGEAGTASEAAEVFGNTPRNLTATPTANGIQLDWEPPETAAMPSYRVYYATSSGNYLHRLEAGYAVSFLASRNFAAGQRYFFVVTAMNSAGVESGASNEVATIFDPSASQPEWLGSPPPVFFEEPVVEFHAAAPTESPALSEEGPAELLLISILAAFGISIFAWRRKLLAR